MIFSREYLENSLIEYDESYLSEFFDGETQEEICTEYLISSIKNIPNTGQRIISLIQHMKNDKYTEARKCLGVKDDFIMYCDEIARLRLYIKCYLSNLIGVRNYSLDQVKELGIRLQNDRKSYFDHTSPQKGFTFNEIFEKIYNIQTPEDHLKFCDFFEVCIRVLCFDLAEIFTRRVKYSIANLEPSLEIEIIGIAPEFEAHLDKARNFVQEFERKISELKIKVLVVEDNPISEKMLPRFLKNRWKVCVDKAMNGKIAVEMVSLNHYDLVIMDIFMPVMDGIETTKAIRAIEGEYFQKVPIFGLHYGIDEVFQTRMVQCGMTGWLEKPVDFDQIILKLSKYLK